MADAFVVVGCGLMMLALILDEIKLQKEKKLKKETSHAEDNA